MPRIVADRILEFTSTTGVGNYTVSGAISGYRTFASVNAIGDDFTYYAEDVSASGLPTGLFETGLGQWLGTNSFQRMAIYASSNGNAAVNWPVGTRRVSLSLLANASLGPTIVVGALSVQGNISGNLSTSTVDGVNPPGFRHVPQISQSLAYTLLITDAGKHILHPSADVTARTFTIPDQASVPYPIGAAITFVNQASAGIITIAITTDVMRLAGAGTTGSRTLAANGVATAIKLTSNEWIISGVGLT